MKKGTKTMNMKKLVVALALAGAGVAFADVAVTGVKVQPRSPWNGLVDIEYTIACDDPDADIYINPTVYDGDRRITLFPSAFTGDGATSTVKAGKHRLVWDAVKDFGAFSCANFQFKIYAGKRLAKYVKIDLATDGDSVPKFPVTLSCVGPDVSKDDCRTKELWLRLVPPGEFWMGSPVDELGRSSNEDLHHVTFTQPFYMGVFEVTQEQYCRVLELPSGSTAYFCNATNSAVRPMEKVTVLDMRGACLSTDTTLLQSKNFISMLRQKIQKGVFDLPSESRWEYACRAGTTTALNSGKNLSNVTGTGGDGALEEVGAYYGNSCGGNSYSSSSVSVGTRRVGSFKPNALGLFDMHGNVSELCLDSYGSGSTGWGYADLVDPAAKALRTSYRQSTPSYFDYTYSYVIRGGAWCLQTKDNRSARRFVSNRSEPLPGATSGGQTQHGSGDRYYFPAGSAVTGFRVCAEAGL